MVVGLGKHTQCHAHRDIRILDHFREFLEADLTIVVQVGFHDCLVNDLCRSVIIFRAWTSRALAHLLQLLILEIASDHHLEHDEQFTIADVAVSIDVVHLERETQLLFLVALRAECAQTGHELLEINVSSSVLVEYGNHSRR